jgi:hypothetical protein
VLSCERADPVHRRRTSALGGLWFPVTGANAAPALDHSALANAVDRPLERSGRRRFTRSSRGGT